MVLEAKSSPKIEEALAEEKVTLLPTSHVQKINGDYAKSMWEAIRKATKVEESIESALLEEVDLDSKMIDLEIQSLYGD